MVTVQGAFEIVTPVMKVKQIGPTLLVPEVNGEFFVWSPSGLLVIYYLTVALEKLKVYVDTLTFRMFS